MTKRAFLEANNSSLICCILLLHEFDPRLVPKVGNAAYHNDYLYDQLKRCIPHLTTLLLGDEEEKTKANAAGALSNLVRNSSKLCEEIISKGAIQVDNFQSLCTP